MSDEVFDEWNELKKRTQEKVSIYEIPLSTTIREATFFMKRV